MALFKRNRQAKIHTPDNVRDTADLHVVESNPNKIWELINKLRDLSQVREYKYAEYDLMEAEVIISSALDMYADDSSQVDETSRRIFTVDCDNEVLRNDLYSFLDRMKIEERIRETAYNLAKFGNKYWKLYLNEKNNDIDHIEEIDDPSSVLDLYYQGNPVYFAQNPDTDEFYKGSYEFELYDHDAFVHFYIRSGRQNDIIRLRDNEHQDRDGEPLEIKYRILEGESLLEGVRVIYRIIKTLEDSLLAARLAKTDYVRIFNVEVGAAATNTDARLIVNKVKRLFDSNVSINLRDGQYSAEKQPRAWADPIFNSVSNGKGAISVDTIGGDFEVRSIVDIDYFNNKLFAGLRIPKPWLGFEESIAGGLTDNESTMVQLDIRYARFIKKVIDAMVNGLTELCNTWLKIRKRENEIGKFKIVYASPSGAEAMNKIQELATRVEIIANLVNTITADNPGVNRSKLLIKLVDQFITDEVFKQAVIEQLEQSTPISQLQVDNAKQALETALETGDTEFMDDENLLNNSPDQIDLNFNKSTTNQVGQELPTDIQWGGVF